MALRFDPAVETVEQWFHDNHAAIYEEVYGEKPIDARETMILEWLQNVLMERKQFGPFPLPPPTNNDGWVLVSSGTIPLENISFAYERPEDTPDDWVAHRFQIIIKHPTNEGTDKEVQLYTLRTIEPDKPDIFNCSIFHLDDENVMLSLPVITTDKIICCYPDRLPPHLLEMHATPEFTGKLCMTIEGRDYDGPSTTMRHLVIYGQPLNSAALPSSEAAT